MNAPPSPTVDLHNFGTAHATLTWLVIGLTALSLGLGGATFLFVSLRRHDGIRMLASAGLGIFAISVFGHIITRLDYVDRPFVVFGFEPLFPHAVNASFPSSLTATIAVGTGVALIATPRCGIALLVATVMVAFGCVYVGVHWVDDVVVGGLLGLLCGAVAWHACGRPPVVAILAMIDQRLPGHGLRTRS